MRKNLYENLIIAKNNPGLVERKERDWVEERENVNKEISVNIDIIKELAEKLIKQGKEELGVKLCVALAGADTEFSISMAEELYDSKRIDLAAPIVAELIKYDREAIKSRISQSILKGDIESDVEIALNERSINPDFLTHIRDVCVKKERSDLVKKIDQICNNLSEETTNEDKTRDELQAISKTMRYLLDEDKYIAAAEKAFESGDVRLINIFGVLISTLNKNGYDAEAAEIASIMARFYSEQREEDDKEKKVA